MLPDTLQLPILKAISSYGADLTDECMDFFERKYSLFGKPDDEFLRYTVENAQYWFSNITGPPIWVQNPEWQFDDGVPMIFVSRVLLPKASGIFHDDAYIFVFVNEKGSVKTVLQIS